MDKMVIFNKIESLRRCINRIREKTPETAGQLESDIDLQDIITVNLERAVQTSVDMAAHIIAELESPAPETMAEAFVILEKNRIIPPELSVKMQKAVAFRNIAVHAYQKMNWNIVHKIAKDGINDFVEFARLVTEKMGN
ncbi:MAG TPA: hypothetical protein DET40_17630 [Lentisphaeria bacterium]|nr:MAG: hypothetical protein A2X45_02375 [Lentisphaerae bacterium GWF2_50_93]HCE45363.1 hypothetical protein [Lentisphaeria bacterium]